MQPVGAQLCDGRRGVRKFVCEGVVNVLEDDRNILCVAHGGLYIAMLPIIFKNIDHAFADEFPHTTPTVAELRADGLHCITWCGKEITS